MKGAMPNRENNHVTRFSYDSNTEWIKIEFRKYAFDYIGQAKWRRNKKFLTNFNLESYRIS